jgi:tetratricopeptide (TPR) repeat protein
LELGVRWALRDAVTIIISQSTEDLKFNVFANRAILYYPDILIKAIDDIVEAIKNGLLGSKSDSPVRLNTRYVTVPRVELDNLHAQIEHLTKARGEDLLRAALVADKPSERLALLKRALEANPASIAVLLETGKTYRVLAQYDEAEKALRQALRLAPEDSVLHRELGVTYSKSGSLHDAIEALREAVRLSPRDAEAWSNLGGALRRVGMAGAPANFDQGALRQSRDSYAEAHAVDRFDLYSALNVSRLDVLLSKWEPQRAMAAREGFAKQVYLCRFMAQESPKDYWRRFDLADALLFSGELTQALDAFDDAIALVPVEARANTLTSVLGPLRNYVTAGVLDETLLAHVNIIIQKLELAGKAS